MAHYEKDEVPMLSESRRQKVDEPVDPNFQKFLSRAHSASVSIHMDSLESYERDTYHMGHTGPLVTQRRIPYIQMSGPLQIGNKPENIFHYNYGITGNKKAETKGGNLLSSKGTGENDWKDENHAGTNEHLLRSGQLGMCNDPYCTTCPTYFKSKVSQQKVPKSSAIFDPKFHSALYGDAKGWAEKFFSFLIPYIPGIMNPHTKIVQQWSQFFAISCLVAIFVDPLYFFLLAVKQENKCIYINSQMTTILVLVRSITDLICFFNMLLQFRLAYVAPETRVVGTGDLVDHPKTIALHYLKGYFFVDLFIVLPLPQVIILFVLPRYLGLSGANYAKNLLRTAILIQYIPRLFRFLPLLIGQSPSGFIFESAWANFVINLLTFMLSGHVAGSCWYLFGLQRVNQCLRNVCHNSPIKFCSTFIDCGHGDTDNFELYTTWSSWKNNSDAIACFTSDGFPYGIYTQAVNLTTEGSVLTRYIYALFWGFQQISTLAGNQVPSYFVWEVLFTMGIIGLGLLLFALLIGNMQNFLQSLGRRRLEMQLRQRDVEQWMRHRRLPDDLRRKVREAERYNWAATRGVNEEYLLGNLPEDLQRDIRRHLFKFLKKVHIFALMDDTILDAFSARLKQNTYIKDSKIIYFGGPIEKMVFIVRGKLEIIGEDGAVASLSEGDACGEELLTWCLQLSSVNGDDKKMRFPRQSLISNRTATCLTNVEAFSLRAADLEELTSYFARFLRTPRVLGAIRYESHYWRSLAATRIQVAWRYRKKRLQRAQSSNIAFVNTKS